MSQLSTIHNTGIIGEFLCKILRNAYVCAAERVLLYNSFSAKNRTPWKTTLKLLSCSTIIIPDTQVTLCIPEVVRF